jgi:hypothetical protein
MIFFDRSRVVADWTCRRRRWWNYEYQGRGLSPRRENIALTDGIAVHDGIARILLGGDVRETALACADSVRQAILNDRVDAGLDPAFYAEEQACLSAGLILGWDRLLKPRLLEAHRIHAVEESVAYEFGDLTMAVKPDLLLEREDDGSLWYHEWKTTGTLTREYFESWHYAVQLQATLKVISERVRPVVGAVIHALYKGVQREGRQLSPFVYAYQRRDGDLSYSYTAGTTRVPVWEHRDIVEWVGRMPREVLEAQFGETPPIFYNPLLAEEFFLQREEREGEIRVAREAITTADDPATALAVLRSNFPQNFAACRPAFGAACAFRNLCFIPQVARAPLASGEFVLRQPHHDLEELE